MRANGIADYTFANGIMQWQFAGGKTVAFDCNKVPEYVAADDYIRAVLHNGWKQKIADSAANQTEKFVAMSECVERLNLREYNMERVGAPSEFIEACLRAYPDKNPSAVREWAKSLDKTKRDAASVMKPISTKLAEIRAERVKRSKLDGNEILATMPQ